MKGTLSFNLPEEAQDFEDAMKVQHYISVICELDNFLRSQLKYEELTEEQANCFQTVRDKLWEFRKED